MASLKFNIYLILAFSSINYAQFISSKEYNSVISLKVLLVEFQDVKHRNPEYPANLALPAYTYDDFNNMLFSENQYCSPNMYSPDGEKVFGSLSDYYRIMSNNKLNIIGNVINEDLDHDNVPDWIVLDSSKSYYDNNRGKEFREKSKAKAKAIGLDISTEGKVFLAIIYAGHTYRSRINTLNPEAFADKHEYIIGERFASGFPYQEERDNSVNMKVSHFTHIGIHAHEFGHLIGLEDHCGPTDNFDWDLMSSGVFNGPLKAGACPAPINPYDRSRLGWSQIIRFGDSTEVKVSYDLKNPQIYYLEDPKTFDFFLVELRYFNSNMNLGDFNIPDYNSYIHNIKENNGLLVWRKIKNNNVKLLHSCGENCSNPNHQIFPGEQNVRVLTPWSDNRDPRYGDFWIPNTKPGNDLGIEIKSVQTDSFVVDLYQKNPWLSSPSKINDLSNSGDEEIILNWRKNLEPDLDYYRIYKMDDDSTYIIYDSTYSNNYIDNNVSLYSESDDISFVSYKITAVDLDKQESVLSDEIKIMLKQEEIVYFSYKDDQTNNFVLSQNYPNPFNPSTTIKYTIPERSNVTLKVFDVLGNEVVTLVNREQSQGNYSCSFNASNLTSGTYFCRLQTGEFVDVKKMLLVK